MKIKKQLKQERKKIDQRILAEGKTLHDQLAEQYCVQSAVQKPAKKSYASWIVATSCVLVVCLVIGLCVFLTQPKIPEYLEQNVTRIKSSVEEFNVDTNSDIVLGDDFILVQVMKAIDSLSSDKLYYNISFEQKNGIVTGVVEVVINKHYNYTGNHIGEPQKDKFGNYDMEYSVEEFDLSGLPMNRYFGCINYNDYKIYFTFEDVKLETSSPKTVLNQLLILK